MGSFRYLIKTGGIMNNNTTVYSPLLSVLVLLAFLSCSGRSENDEWISLFNGKDLTGWKIKITGHELNDNYKSTFRVEDGLIKASYEDYDKFNNEFGHIFYDRKLSHFKLRVEYRFVGEQVEGGPGWGFMNNGIMFHGQSPESMRIDQAFPVSIEAQLLGGN